MGCQSKTYTSSDGFVPIFYLNQSITSGICDISNKFKGLVGGSRKRKRRKTKSKKYRKYK